MLNKLDSYVISDLFLPFLVFFFTKKKKYLNTVNEIGVRETPALPVTYAHGDMYLKA